jgi:protein-S-isoprenylcysteine O-methyltransferase Ste14
MADNMQDNAGVIAPPPLIYAGALAAGLLLHAAFPVKFLPRGVARVLGAILIGISGVVVTFAIREMRRADTPVNPTEPTKALVVEGPFRFTRNPLYLSLTLLYAGIASFVNALWAMLLLPVALIVMNRGVIDREERYLERKFGEEYISYKKRVRRWL